MVNSALPPEYRDYTRTLGQDEIDDMLGRMAVEHPEKYKEVTHALVQLGRNAAFDEGSTITLRDLVPVVDKKQILATVKREADAIRADSRLTPEQKEDAISTLYGEATKRLTAATYDNAIANNNPFAIQVKYRARGSKNALGAMLTTPGTYTDSTGKLVPIFIDRSYAEGLKPHEYWAASYGARLGVISTKLSTQKGGYLDKMMNSASIDQVVTEDDCGTSNGLPVAADDDDNIGSVLQRDAAGFKAGTVITKQVLDAIKAKKIDEIVVRSPITCSAKNGLCKRCLGIRESGKFPEIGYNAGINAASALGERVTQGALNVKHCLFEDTLVLLANYGVKAIKDLKPGDMVIGSDTHGRTRPVQVLALHDNGFEECVEFSFRTARHRSGIDATLVCTTNHKILCDIVKSQDGVYAGIATRTAGTTCKRFVAATPDSFDDSGYRDEPFALLLGALVGDGCYTESVTGVHLSCSDPTEISDLNDSLAGLGVTLSRLRHHCGIYYRVSMPEGSPDRLGNPVKNLLIREDMYGKYAHEKRIPAVMREWSNKSVGDFIGGLIAADGTVFGHSGSSKNTCGVAISSTSRELLEDVRSIMLLRFGIHFSAITLIGKAGGRHNTFTRNHSQYQITISSHEDLVRLNASVTIPGVKRARLASLVTCSERKYSARFVNIAKRPVGIKHVYDITVDHPDHLFVLANGLIVSNSGKRGDLGSYTGFDALKNLTTVPKAFDVKASVADRDGTVTAIDDAPQGGQYVTIDDDHDRSIYVPGNLKASVKVGDKLEAGDAVSTGMISPADVVAYKGVGEGRRYFTNRFRQVFKDSGYGVNRRNVEVLSRALVNNVMVENADSEGSGLPGDIMRYSAWASGYSPREGAETTKLEKATGRYLEAPYLHYTIGTRVTPSVVKELKRHGYTDINTNKTAPGVVPHMVSVVEAPAYSGDWMARLGTSYLKDRLLEDVQNGSTSKLHSTNPIPAMARGVELGKDITTSGMY